MTTIPQRLREIARNGPFDERRSAIFKLADEIAAELEAPAADAVPVVASMAPDGSAFSYEQGAHGRGGKACTEPLIRQRDHLATVSALQARITSLEADLQFRREFQHGAEALAGKYLTQRDDARDRIASLAGENFSLAAGQCIVPGGLCGDESGNQYCSLQDRINELESRQEQVRTFLDIAAGEGLELGGVDAGDLYVKIFGYPQPDTSKEQP